MPEVPANHVRIVNVQAMLDPWTGVRLVAVTYSGLNTEGVIVLPEQRCDELGLRKAVRDGVPIAIPIW